jgi:NTP pyrophosphatase (non-canonical NTP hydrolase)
MDLKKLIKDCKKNANKHGFYIVWEREDKPMNPVEALCKMMSECGEAMEAYVAQSKPNDGKNEIHCENWKEHFEEEIADLLIRTFHLCGDLDIDIDKALKTKMEYNKKRPYKHNKLT